VTLVFPCILPTVAIQCSPFFTGGPSSLIFPPLFFVPWERSRTPFSAPPGLPSSGVFSWTSFSPPQGPDISGHLIFSLTDTPIWALVILLLAGSFPLAGLFLTPSMPPPGCHERDDLSFFLSFFPTFPRCFPWVPPSLPLPESHPPPESFFPHYATFSWPSKGGGVLAPPPLPMASFFPVMSCLRSEKILF